MLGQGRGRWAVSPKPKLIRVNLSSTYRGGTSSVGRALDNRAEGCEFDSRDRINTLGLNITGKKSKQMSSRLLDPRLARINTYNGGSQLVLPY